MSNFTGYEYLLCLCEILPLLCSHFSSDLLLNRELFWKCPWILRWRLNFNKNSDPNNTFSPLCLSALLSERYLEELVTYSEERFCTFAYKNNVIILQLTAFWKKGHFFKISTLKTLLRFCCYYGKLQKQIAIENAHPMSQLTADGPVWYLLGMKQEVCMGTFMVCVKYFCTSRAEKNLWKMTWMWTHVGIDKTTMARIIGWLFPGVSGTFHSEVKRLWSAVCVECLLDFIIIFFFCVGLFPSI